MGNVYRAYGTDKDATKEGVWHEFELNGELLCSMKIRPQHPALNGSWRKARLDLALKLRDWAREHHVTMADAAMEIPEDTDVEMMAEAFFEAIVTDWRDLQAKSGKELAFSKKNFVKVMVDLPLLFDAVQIRSKNWTTYKLEQETDAVKP
ncbi:MAG: hypothetical protein V3S78_06355 [Hyphomicrobium sp.]